MRGYARTTDERRRGGDDNSIAHHRKGPTVPAKKIARILPLSIAAFAAVALSGCGGSVDESLVKSAGEHGNALEEVYVLYNKDVLSKTSSRDLKAINSALAANDLKKASTSDVRKAQKEIDSRIDELSKYERDLEAAYEKLKDTPLPDFAGGLDASEANEDFTKDYTQTTETIQSYTKRGLSAIGVGEDALGEYLDFLEQWEEFLVSDDTGGLVAAGEDSDAALERVNKAVARVDRGGTLNTKIDPLVQSMAESATDSSQLNSLVEDLKDQYPKSFLAVHLVEK